MSELKGAAFYYSGRWVSATARYEGSITNATSSWEQRELLCIKALPHGTTLSAIHTTYSKNER